MATLDIILLCCFIPGIIRGLSKGFLEQALALAGIVLSVWAAFRFSTLVCSWLKPYVNISETTLNVLSFALILIVISLLVVLVAKLLTKVAELAMLGWLDKTLGLVFALAVNALVIGVFMQTRYYQGLQIKLYQKKLNPYGCFLGVEEEALSFRILLPL